MRLITERKCISVAEEAINNAKINVENRMDVYKEYNRVYQQIRIMYKLGLLRSKTFDRLGDELLNVTINTI